jgi:Kae1-associated kinase Bud32
VFIKLRYTTNKQKLIHQGAEASLFYGQWFGKDVIYKQRIPKKYRLEEIDRNIRITRTLNEARALIKIKLYGINVPQVFETDTNSSTIVMKYIEGKRLKVLLNELDDVKKEQIFQKIGRNIAILHQNGHIHGDITTSNIIITKNDDIFLIDFGLHEYSDSIEDKSVDLHLLKRVLISSHGKDYKICFKSFLDGYRSEYKKSKSKDCEEIINNISIIERRGRYVKKEERL